MILSTVSANFPAGVVFQRNCDTGKHVLFDVDGTTAVDAKSITGETIAVDGGVAELGAIRLNVSR